MSRGKERRERKGIVLERIEVLFTEAGNAALEGDVDSADRYVLNARKLSSRNNVSIPRELKRRYCRYCYGYLLPGKSSRVRINSAKKRVEVKCLNCGRLNFHPYIHEVKARRMK
ncbi:MAG: ribonuclease P [Candidatus Altiarchaeales archaeon ex4484_2]|nr:MAG: ribonuclease P [Candidatus Altiarchaeales archaeon ex4484_2]